ncbi:protein FAM221B-like [Lineus longissimus]|uniref:protein FAM221B-like n=1 Tax=Lineus longissimus TaxID=88925 RepID=UPI002B4DFE7B
MASKGSGKGSGQPPARAKELHPGRNPPSKAVVPRTSRAVAQSRPSGPPVRQGHPKEQVVIAPKGYTMREIKPAENYDVISFAKAMNEDFGKKAQKLFAPETEAAVEAQRTGVYIGWRCPEFKWDCIRLGRGSRCFCGHSLSEHDKYTGRSVKVPCKAGSCLCKKFAFVPMRAEDVGEFWLSKRRDFDPATWRCKCRCKHTHEEHDVSGLHRCHIRGCGCNAFSSSSVCAACDKHWEQHETFFETHEDRVQGGLPAGEEYLPFAEIPSLRNMVLTGDEIDESPFLALRQGEGRIPENRALTGNDVPVNFGQRPSGSNFKPTYD